MIVQNSQIIITQIKIVNVVHIICTFCALATTPVALRSLEFERKGLEAKPQIRF